MSVVIYDGRNVYFTTQGNGYIARYGVTLSFTDSNSYTIFNSTTVNSGIRNFMNAVYDGTQYI